MPDNSADQIFEEFQEIVQQAILTGYPNPERTGCVGSAVLGQLASRPRPVRDAAWEHVTHCSPCYREFLELRAAVKHARRRLVVRRRLLVSGAAAALVIAGAITTYEGAHRESQSTTQIGPYQAAALDLKYRSVARGESGHAARTEPLVLPHKLLDLTIYLPIGSEAGTYQVQLVKKIDEPLAKAVGEARIEHGNTILRVHIDLTHFALGPLLIGLRQPPSDWTYYLVTIQ